MCLLEKFYSAYFCADAYYLSILHSSYAFLHASIIFTAAIISSIKSIILRIAK